MNEHDHNQTDLTKPENQEQEQEQNQTDSTEPGSKPPETQSRLETILRQYANHERIVIARADLIAREERGEFR